MQTKPLLYGLIGFFLGGFIVAVAATTFDKPETNDSDMSTTAMLSELDTKSGNAYDQTFIAHMINHHQSAVSMAKLSPTRAQHSEIQQLSKEIIAAQEAEIVQMKQWQKDWGYNSNDSHSTNQH